VGRKIDSLHSTKLAVYRQVRDASRERIERELLHRTPSA
jgi:hypothetical protein